MSYQRAPIMQQQQQPLQQAGYQQQPMMQQQQQQAGMLQPGMQQGGIMQPGMQQGSIQPGMQQYGKPMQSQVYQSNANLHAPAGVSSQMSDSQLPQYNKSNSANMHAPMGVGSSLGEMASQKGMLPQQDMQQKQEMLSSHSHSHSQSQMGQMQPLKLLVSGKELLLKPDLLYTIGSAPDANIHVGGSLTNKIPMKAASIRNNLLQLEPMANMGGAEQWEQLWLNGRTLHSGIDVLLRDGDVLRIGHHEMLITDVHTINNSNVGGVRHEAVTAIPPPVSTNIGGMAGGVVPGTKQPVDANINTAPMNTAPVMAAAPAPVAAPVQKVATPEPVVEKPIPTEPQPMPEVGEFYFTTLKSTTTTAVRNSALEPSASDAETRRYPDRSTVGERNASAAAQQPWELLSQQSQLAPGQSTTLADGTHVAAGNQHININATRHNIE